MKRLIACVIDLDEDNAFIGRVHRHHPGVRGHKFSIGAEKDDKLVGVVIAGRAVARAVNPRHVAEVTRLATDGTKNACSFLYARAARAAEAMGYSKIQTYILASEDGTSLRAAGWHFEAVVKGREWNHTDERQLHLGGGTRRNEHPIEDKQRWAKVLRNP